MIRLAMTYIWLCLFTMVSAIRILAILPYTGLSHFSYNLAILSSLHDAGHQITFVSPFSHLISLPNVTVVDSKRNDTIHYDSKFLITEKLVVNLRVTTQFWRKNGVKSCNDVLSLKKIRALEKLISDAKHGVVVFSLGALTKSSSITDEMLNAFKNAFSRIPQLVIWKYEDHIEDSPPNLLTFKWFPQRDVLAHKNVKAFISHCGISGTYEAIYEAVPVIMTPIFGDQRSNAALLHEKGAGIYLDITSVNSNKILRALDAVINDTSYAKNMQQLSKKFKDRQMSPSENVVYWTEYVVRQKKRTSFIYFSQCVFTSVYLVGCYCIYHDSFAYLPCNYFEKGRYFVNI